MNGTRSSIPGVLGRVALIILLLSASIWSSLAVWFHLGGPGLWRAAAFAAWLVVLSTLGWLTAKRPWPGVVLMSVLVVGVGGWWWSIQPRLDRTWAPHDARTVTGKATGDTATLLNVRDFYWTSTTQANERWSWRKYDLSTLVEADLALYRGGFDAIEHTLVSFRFSDGRRVVFSMEARLERDEEFSFVAGIFKVYELALIAAEERDILSLRTVMGDEDTYSCSHMLSAEDMRALFLDFVKTGNELAGKPLFYNSLTANGTAAIFNLARMVEPGLSPDRTVHMSQNLPGYLIDRSVLHSKKCQMSANPIRDRCRRKSQR